MDEPEAHGIIQESRWPSPVDLDPERGIAVNLTVTVYVVVQAVSPALFASLADAVGRRPVLLALVATYAAATLGLVLSSALATGRAGYAALAALRALQSLGGSTTPPLAYGVAYDLAPVAERGAMLGPMLAFCNGVSAVGPVVGGGIALGTGGVAWVWLALLAVAVACLLLAGFTLPETARSVVGNGRLPATGVWRTWAPLPRACRVASESEARAGGDGPRTKKPECKWQPLRALDSFRIILYPEAAAVLWMIASSYAVYYTFQVAVPVIFADVYGFDELQIGLVLLPGLAGMTLGGLLAGRLLDRNLALVARRRLGPDVGPENAAVAVAAARATDEFPLEAARYRRCQWFLLFMAACVSGYGWAVDSGAHAAVPAVLQFFICAASTLLSHTASALLVDIFPSRPSTAYASAQIARCGLSAVSSAVLQPLVDAVGRGWYFTIFALFIGITGAASMVVTRSKGGDWRRRRRETS
ncbi:Itaconate transport protein [Colletotrichum spinosum]|uniref:Itaconate transport protein n=1 Tax=Colletotrichum spinosum TaxID=1347390 RepID=A0A4R8PZT4_9PEZI|nr:Itaconate transport protein [Colletotrichum spinosum]